MKFSAHCTPPNACPARALRAGDLVIAMDYLDINGARVRAGELGVVFNEEYQSVRWFSGGIYDVSPGEVEYLPDPKEVSPYPR